jgi:hypothetical protein
MRLNRSHLQLAGLAIALLFAIVSSLRTLQQTIVRNPNALVSAEVAPYERRAAQLKPFLPASGYIGYTSDRTDSSSYFRAYYATQYALAPLMFVSIGELPPDVPYTPAPPVADPALIIADFRDQQRLQALRTSLDLVVLAQADDGLALLCRRGARDARGALCQ